MLKKALSGVKIEEDLTKRKVPKPTEEESAETLTLEKFLAVMQAIKVETS